MASGRPAAHARHGVLSCAQSMYDPQHAQPLKLPARRPHAGLACSMLVTAGDTRCGERRRREVDIGFVRSGGWIEWLGLLSLVRGSS